MSNTRIKVRVAILGMIAIAALGIVASKWQLRTVTEPEKLVDISEGLSIAETALSQGDAESAAQFERQFDRRHPQFAVAMLALAEVAQRMGNESEAIRYFHLIPMDGSPEDINARMNLADLHFRGGQWQTASDEFEYILKQQPNHLQALSSYSLLLDFSNQRYRASRLIFSLVQRDHFSLDHLLYLANSSTVHSPIEEIQRKEPHPSDALVNLSIGRFILLQEKLDEAEPYLLAAKRLRPDLAEVSIRLGEVLLIRKDIEGFQAWDRSASVEVQSHPVYWQLKGQLAEQVNNPRGAARCYWESLRIDPNNRVPNYRLAQLLQRFHRESDAEAFLQSSSTITDIINSIDLIHHNRHHTDSMRVVAEATESLGRYWEAMGWARSALVVDSDLVWAQQLLARVGPRVLPDSPQNDLKVNPTLRIDLSSFPLPEYPSSTVSSAPQVASSEAQFSEEASALELDFTYFNGPDLSTPGGRMFEFTGGGVAILDFDRDGHADVYMPQGCEWPPVEGNGRHLDRLFRLQGGRYVDSTTQASLFEDRFSQGATIGDYDQDGFQDIYVANTHVNRLWRNMGDGTFEDGTSAAGIDGSLWTTSCLLADLNGDTLPDLVDVNYTVGDDIFSRICDTGGVVRSCSPLVFTSCSDRLWLNSPEGVFTEASKLSGFEGEDGRGLGLVAYSGSNRSGMLDLFVANDMTKNFSFQNQQTQRGSFPQYQELGILSGLAFDVNGDAQASMGVAAADADGNGLLDFYVTNFYQESNNLYLQQPEGGFIDHAASAGLRSPSLQMLGFGTQFLDANLDGWPDLIVTNGHVDDFRHRGTPYQMRTQFFENAGEGKFTERFAKTLGPFFEREFLGRGLATLDWNRDRKQDVVISYLDAPAAVLTNHTSTKNHAISIQLVGTTVDREAIGTVIEANVGDRRLVSQLTAGDGYMASNERKLILGLRDHDQVERLQVNWTDGTSVVFDGLSADKDYIIVQGGLAPLALIP